jgi:hypothetical protein
MSRQIRLRLARSCYDHLAGAGAEALVRGGALRPVGGRDYDLTARGEEVLGGLGVDVAGLRRQRRAFARCCLDWTERRPHLSGALGAALLVRLLDLGWLVGGRVPRGLVLTDAGRDGLLRVLVCDAAVLQDQASGGQSCLKHTSAQASSTNPGRRPSGGPAGRSPPGRRSTSGPAGFVSQPAASCVHPYGGSPRRKEPGGQRRARQVPAGSGEAARRAPLPSRQRPLPHLLVWVGPRQRVARLGRAVGVVRLYNPDLAEQLPG